MGGRGAYRNFKAAVTVSAPKVKPNPKRVSAEHSIATVLQDLKKNGFSAKQPFSIGLVEKRMRDFAEKNNIELPSKSVYMSSRSISHSTRQFKSSHGKTVSGKDLIKFPKNRRTMDLYYDGKAFIYSDYKNKYIVNPNYKIKIRGKKKKIVNFITAGKVNDPKEFNLRKYVKVD